MAQLPFDLVRVELMMLPTKHRAGHTHLAHHTMRWGREAPEDTISLRRCPPRTGGNDICEGGVEEQGLGGALLLRYVICYSLSFYSNVLLLDHGTKVHRHQHSMPHALNLVLVADSSDACLAGVSMQPALCLRLFDHDLNAYFTGTQSPTHC